MNHHARPRSGAVLEGLERRRLLAAAVSLVSGKLTVTGTPGADVLSVAPLITKSGIKTIVTANGVAKTFTGSITSIFMTGDKGDDQLSVDPAITVKSTLYGNAGN